MNKSKISGVIEHISFEELLFVLKNIFGHSPSEIKDTIQGEEIIYTGERLNFYFHPEGNSMNYLLEGEFLNGSAQAEEFVIRLVNVLNEKQKPYAFEYYAEDNDGNKIESYKEIKHPDYGR